MIEESSSVLSNSPAKKKPKEEDVLAKKNMRFLLPFKIEGLDQECLEGELSMMKTRNVAQNREGTLLIT